MQAASQWRWLSESLSECAAWLLDGLLAWESEQLSAYSL